MRAAILAAGSGSRFRRHFDGPKPLFPLLGIPLIVRNILGLREAGVHEFVIITGCYDRELRDYLGDGSQWGVSIHYVHNSRWQLGNGTSAHAFREVYRPEEKFVLLMADHLFDPEVFQDVIAEAEQLDEGDVLLAADRRVNDVYRLEESTKIVADGDVARQLGKELAQYDAVDCGLFLCTGALLEALSQAIDQGRYTLTDGVNILTREGRVKLHFVDRNWVDVDDLESCRHGENMLLKSLIPEKDGFVSKHLNRKISLRITRWLAPTRVTPNQISFVSFLICLLSALCFGLGHPFAGGILAQFGCILDGVDGEIARLNYKKSSYGALFDSILDRYADYFMIIGMGYWWFQHSDYPGFALIASMLALSGQPMSMLIKEKYKSSTGQTFIPERDDGIFRYVPANRDGRLFLIMLGGIFHLIPATLIILAIISHGQTIVRLVSLRRKM